MADGHHDNGHQAPAEPGGTRRDVRLSYADQTFVNFCAVLVCTRIEGREDKRLAMDVARDVFSQVNRNHRYLARICDAFEALDTGGPSVVRGFEVLNLSTELAKFFKWRGSLSYDAFAAAAPQQKGPDV